MALAMARGISGGGNYEVANDYEDGDDDDYSYRRGRGGELR